MRLRRTLMQGCVATVIWAAVSAVPLPADTIFNYVATNARVQGPIGIGTAAFASAPGFAFSGGPPSFGFTPFQVGDQVPLDITFGDISPDSSAVVDFGGLVQLTTNLSGNLHVNTSPSGFVLPPNPDLTYTFASRAIGQITALPFCMSPGEEFPPGVGPFPPCGTSAVLSIDLPGTLTIRVMPANPASPNGPVFFVSEVFDSTPVPEPSGPVLLLLSICAGCALRMHGRSQNGNQ
jgi:hypothetical protein